MFQPIRGRLQCKFIVYGWNIPTIHTIPTWPEAYSPPSGSRTP